MDPGRPRREFRVSAASRRRGLGALGRCEGGRVDPPPPTLEIKSRLSEGIIYGMLFSLMVYIWTLFTHPN